MILLQDAQVSSVFVTEVLGIPIDFQITVQYNLKLKKIHLNHILFYTSESMESFSEHEFLAYIVVLH